jgi:hypothetical protein
VESEKMKKSNWKAAAAKTKKYSWRVTATYIWFHLLSRLFLGFDGLTFLEGTLANRLVTGLSLVGFNPVHGEYLPLVLKTTWTLIITSFSFTELIGFALFYVLLMPFWLPLRFVFREALKEARNESKNTPAVSGLRYPESKPPVLATLTTLLAGWYLLYGAGAGRAQIVPGLVISGCLLTYTCYRAVLRAKPFGEVEVDFLMKIAAAGLIYVDSEISKEEQRSSNSTKGQILVDMKMNLFAERIIRIPMLIIRGKRGQDRAAALILLDYIFMLVFLGSMAVITWALLLKFYTAPVPISLGLSAQFIASKFLPGMQALQIPVQVPPWFNIGPSVTAWILFGLYVGPASSLLASRQKAYARGVASHSKDIKKIWRNLRRLMRIKKKLVRRSAVSEATVSCE